MNICSIPLKHHNLDKPTEKAYLFEHLWYSTLSNWKKNDLICLYLCIRAFHKTKWCICLNSIGDVRWRYWYSWWNMASFWWEINVSELAAGWAIRKRTLCHDVWWRDKQRYTVSFDDVLYLWKTTQYIVCNSTNVNGVKLFVYQYTCFL